MSGERHKGYDPTNPNSGHGWIFLRPDGMKARCGGPAVCETCQADLSHPDSGRQAQNLAIQALKADGYQETSPSYWDRQTADEQGGIYRVLLGTDFADIRLVCKTTAVPALLKPITKERLNQAAHDLAFKILTTCKTGNTIHVNKVDKVVKDFVAGFYPEEAPTDANPG